MNKKEIQKKYNEKIRLIIKYNEYYYNESSSLVPDKDYDELKKDILLLEKKYSFLNSKKSPSKIIGHKPSKNFKKIPHRVPMLSLANAFEKEDLINFEKKKWISAINRFQTIVNDYETTIYAEEALHRLVEVHYIIGLKDEAKKYAKLLGYNYQSSEWYKKSYKIFNQDYSFKKIKKEKKGVIKRFKKLFD